MYRITVLYDGPEPRVTLTSPWGDLASQTVRDAADVDAAADALRDALESCRTDVERAALFAAFAAL